MTTPRHSSGARFVLALLALLALTALSYGLHLAGLGAAGPPVAFAIAGVKVLVVALVFMDLSGALPATRLVALIAVLFVALLCFGVVGDVALR